MRRSIAALLLVSAALPAYAGIDTLRHYNPGSKQIYFRDASINTCVARFEPAAPGYLTDVYVTLGGRADGSAVIRLYGHEGGSVVPVLKDDLTGPLTVRKTREGEERIHIKLSDRLPLHQNQFFVSVSDMSEGVYLVSDSEKRLPACLTEQGGRYFYQFVELAGGEWRSYHAAFRIDIIIDYFADTSPNYLEDVTDSAGIDPSLSAAAMAWGDINDDTFADLVVDGRLYINNGDGSFRDGTEAAGLRGKALAYACVDINNDKAVDILFLGCEDIGYRSRLYLNSGTGAVSERELEIPVLTGVAGFSIADINGDKLPDLFIGQRSGETTPVRNYLLLNRGELQFSDISDSLYAANGRSPSGRCHGSMWVDYDNDGLLDLYVTNSDGIPSELWKNNGNLSFTPHQRVANLSVDAMFNAVGCDWADYDNDGDIDLILAHSHPSLLVERDYRFSTVFINSGAPGYSFVSHTASFSNAAFQFEERQAGGTWGDVDNDGLLDLFITTVSPCHFNDLYVQQPDHSFAMRTFDYGLWRTAEGDDAVWVDFNNDGKLDLATGHNGKIRLFRNKSHSLNNSVQFDLQSNSSNTQAIGGRVAVYADGRRYVRDIVAGRGMNMQGMPRVHIGLGNDERIDSVVVHWPNGSTENFGAVGVNALHRLREGRSSEVTAQYDDPGLTVYPNPFREEAAISYSVAGQSYTRLAVYSLTNKVVRTLVAESSPPGEYTVLWDGKDDNGVPVASGMYIVRVQVGSREGTARIIVSE